MDSGEENVVLGDEEENDAKHESLIEVQRRQHGRMRKMASGVQWRHQSSSRGRGTMLWRLTVGGPQQPATSDKSELKNFASRKRIHHKVSITSKFFNISRGLRISGII